VYYAAAGRFSTGHVLPPARRGADVLQIPTKSPADSALLALDFWQLQAGDQSFEIDLDGLPIINDLDAVSPGERL
jgi:hypothetical protein